MDDNLETLARSLLKRCHFPQWDMRAEQLWAAQDASVQQLWLSRAMQVIQDMESDGLRLSAPAPWTGEDD